jgi:translation initiation factor IF-2
MNISTLAKILGVSINDLRSTGTKASIFGFSGRNTRIPYQSALDVTKILRPDKVVKLTNDDKIYLPNSLSVSEFAETVGRTPSQVIKTLLLNGVIATLNEKIDYDTASLIAEELGVEVFPEQGELFAQDTPDDLNLIKSVEYDDIAHADRKYVSRPPVVTIMGHVDHGKTTLLDTIRESNVVATEAGSITQHISSYQISYKEKKITFIDTPGHAAFTAMRARGSQLADFVILVVSAVEGPKPQTVEVIERAKMSKTPVIVAINKIDLPNSDIERVKTELTKFGLTPEEWGGETPFIPISAKINTNIDTLLDTILLHAEVADLKGQVDCPGQGVVIESHLDTKLGVVSTVLVTKESLKIGDFLQCGITAGKIKKLESSLGLNIETAGLCEPVMLLGLPQICDVGEAVVAFKSQKEANVAATMEQTKRINKKTFISPGNSSAEDNQINLILKADVSGSLEALKESIIKIPQDKIKLVIKAESVGEVNENDADFASITKSTILAFHTKISSQSANIIKKQEVGLVQSDIIYEILEWIEEQILKNTKHETKITFLGSAKVLALFKSEKNSIQVFGGEVIDGKILSGKNLKLMRDGEEVGDFEVIELQKNKQKVTEANISQQFGMSVSGKGKIQIGDTIKSYDETVIM